MTGGTVVVVGSVNADLTTTVPRHPAPGETVLGGGGTVTPGGKGANQALAAARMGADVTLLGAVGDDAHAGAALELLREEGVDLSAVCTVGGPTGLAVITVAESAENTIVVVPGANAHVTPEHVDQHLDALRRSTICVLQGELPVDTTEHTMRLASTSGTRVILNLAPVIDIASDVLGMADLLVVNEHEAEHLLQTVGVPSPRASDPVQAATALSRALCAVGPASVVVTCGEHGAVVLDGNGEPVHLTVPHVEPRDTTGAGDAFVGALAAGLAAGQTVVRSAATAVRVGAFTVQYPGAQPSYPRKEDVLP